MLVKTCATGIGGCLFDIWKTSDCIIDYRRPLSITLTNQRFKATKQNTPIKHQSNTLWINDEHGNNMTTKPPLSFHQVQTNTLAKKITKYEQTNNNEINPERTEDPPTNNDTLNTTIYHPDKHTEEHQQHDDSQNETNNPISNLNSEFHS